MLDGQATGPRSVAHEGPRPSPKGLVAIVGCTSLGASFATRLSAAGRDVCVVTDTESALNRLDRDFQGFTYVIDDLSNAGALESCGLADAGAMFSLMLSDNANILVAHLARRIWKVPVVVARLADADKADLLEDFGIDVICPIELCERELLELSGFDEGGELA
jgi:trk system potassium uptake protein TrkA